MKPKNNILDFEVMRCARENKISYKTALRVYGDLVFQEIYDNITKDFEMFCMGRPHSDYNEMMFTELRNQVYDKPLTPTGWTNSPEDFNKFWFGDDDKA